MATVTTDGVEAGKRSRRSPRLTPGQPGGKRNRTAIVLGVLLILVCGAAAATLYADASKRPSVVVVARDVSAGSRIAAADLRTAGVAADPPVQPIPASARSRVVGRVARVGLVAGSVLTPDQLARRDTVPAGRSVVAVLLAFGQAPNLVPGDQVLVVSPAEGLNAPAEVFAVDEEAGSGDELRVSLLTDEQTGARIAAVAAERSAELSLVLRGGP